MIMVLDTSYLIAQANPDDKHHAAATSILASWSHYDYAASVMTLAEFYVIPAQTDKLAQAHKFVDNLRVRALDIPADAAAELAAIRADNGLKLPDACVLYAAQQHGEALATFDAKLAAAALASGLRVPRPGDAPSNS